MQIVLGLVYHINNPCVEPTTGQNIRKVYLSEALNLILEDKIQNEGAKETLIDAIREHWGAKER